jgi:hypothetical protein
MMPRLNYRGPWQDLRPRNWMNYGANKLKKTQNGPILLNCPNCWNEGFDFSILFAEDYHWLIVYYLILSYYNIYIYCFNFTLVSTWCNIIYLLFPGCRFLWNHPVRRIRTQTHLSHSRGTLLKCLFLNINHMLTLHHRLLMET